MDPYEEAKRYRRVKWFKDRKKFLGQVPAEDGRNLNTLGYATAEEAARAVDRFIYKIEGPSAELNFPLTPEQRAELDGLSLAQVDAQFREEGKQGFTFASGVSALRGVAWEKSCQLWKAKLKIAGKTVNLGSFTTEEAAGRAYDAAAWWKDGAKARLNFPDEFHGVENPPQPPPDILAKLRAAKAGTAGKAPKTSGKKQGTSAAAAAGPTSKASAPVVPHGTPACQPELNADAADARGPVSAPHTRAAGSTTAGRGTQDTPGQGATPAAAHAQPRGQPTQQPQTGAGGSMVYDGQHAPAVGVAEEEGAVEQSHTDDEEYDEEVSTEGYEHEGEHEGASEEAGSDDSGTSTSGDDSSWYTTDGEDEDEEEEDDSDSQSLAGLAEALQGLVSQGPGARSFERDVARLASAWQQQHDDLHQVTATDLAMEVYLSGGHPRPPAPSAAAGNTSLPGPSSLPLQQRATAGTAARSSSKTPAPSSSHAETMQTTGPSIRRCSATEALVQLAALAGANRAPTPACESTAMLEAIFKSYPDPSVMTLAQQPGTSHGGHAQVGHLQRAAASTPAAGTSTAQSQAGQLHSSEGKPPAAAPDTPVTQPLSRMSLSATQPATSSDAATDVANMAQQPAEAYVDKAAQRRARMLAHMAEDDKHLLRDARRWMGETVSSSDEEDLDWGEEAALPPRTAPGSPDGSSDHPGPSHAGAAGDELPPNPGACPGPFQAVPMVVDEEGVVRPLHEELRKCGEFLSGLNAEHPLPQPPPPGAANSAAFKQALSEWEAWEALLGPLTFPITFDDDNHPEDQARLLNLIAQLNATITRGAIGPIDPDLLILDPEPGPGPTRRRGAPPPNDHPVYRLYALSQVRIPIHEAEVAIGLHDPRGAFESVGGRVRIPEMNDPFWGLGGHGDRDAWDALMHEAERKAGLQVSEIGIAGLGLGLPGDHPVKAAYVAAAWAEANSTAPAAPAGHAGHAPAAPAAAAAAPAAAAAAGGAPPVDAMAEDAPAPAPAPATAHDGAQSDAAGSAAGPSGASTSQGSQVPSGSGGAGSSRDDLLDTAPAASWVSEGKFNDMVEDAMNWTRMNNRIADYRTHVRDHGLDRVPGFLEYGSWEWEDTLDGRLKRALKSARLARGTWQIKDSQRLQGVCRDLAFSNLEYEAEERPALRPGHPEYDPVERYCWLRAFVEEFWISAAFTYQGLACPPALRHKVVRTQIEALEVEGNRLCQEPPPGQSVMDRLLIAKTMLSWQADCEAEWGEDWALEDEEVEECEGGGVGDASQAAAAGAAPPATGSGAAAPHAHPGGVAASAGDASTSAHVAPARAPRVILPPNVRGPPSIVAAYYSEDPGDVAEWIKGATSIRLGDWD